MFGLKVVVAALIVATCAEFCVYWNAAVQPDVAVSQAMRQMEFHVNGQGNQLAAEREQVGGTT